MLKNQLLVVQKPFQWEGVIQMDPRILSKSSKSFKRSKQSHGKNPYKHQKTLSGGEKHKKTVKRELSAA